jgi:diguanylate cyclase (GGDEF)-like protein/PAS domain S-box-containing protein
VGHLTEERFRALVAQSSDIITVLEPDGTWRSSSAAGTRLLGYEEGFDPEGGIFSLVHADDVDRARHAFQEVLDGTRNDEPLVLRVRSADGSRWFHLETVARNLVDAPEVRGVVLNSRDITERVEAEQLARQLTEVLERSNEIIVLSDPAGNVVYANQRAREFLSLGADQHVGELTSVESRERLRDVIMPLVRRHGLWNGELTLRSTSGNEVPVIATIQTHRDAGEITLISTIAHDITELKAAQHRLEYEATHDALTGLPNRAMLQEVGEQALGRASRHDTTTALLFLDLDMFKDVNDTLGHDAGDAALVELGRRLRVGIRTGDLVARLGGDEFCVLCEAVESRDEMLELGQRLCDVVSIPMVIQGREVQLGTSIGIAFDDGGSRTIGQLIRDADVALYRAKRAGGSRVTVFDTAMVDDT